MGTPVEKLEPGLLWYIHGKAYDLAEFAKFHPGGEYILLNCRGEDCSALFETFHPFTDRARHLLMTMAPVDVPASVLKERCVDRSERQWFFVPGSEDPVERDPLWETIRTRVGTYLRENGIERTMGWPCFLFLLSLVLLTPVVWWFGYMSPVWWVSVPSTVAMAVIGYVSGGRLGHDGSHAALSRKHWLMHLMGNIAGLPLINVGYWEVEHVVRHHQETNTATDPDLYHFFSFMRHDPAYPWRPMHRFQKYRPYVYLVFCFNTFAMLYIEPLRMLLFKSGTDVREPFKHTRLRPINAFRMVAHMLIYPVLMLALPIYLNWTSFDSKLALVAYRVGLLAIYLAITGVCLGLFVLCTHPHEFAVQAASKPTSWAQQQVETTANYRPDMPWYHPMFLLFVGASAHADHHLMPTVSSDKLRYIHPIIRETCEEFGVDYRHFASYKDVIDNTHDYLTKLSYKS